MEPKSKDEILQSLKRKPRCYNILIGVTGSVATIKIRELVEKLKLLSKHIQVCVVATEKSLTFFNSADVSVPVFRDVDEWSSWRQRGDPVLHIEIRRWADMMLIAPLDANTLAKLANGICDNLLTCVGRAWDVKKPLIFCPAMNTFMYEHPLTEIHRKFLTETLKYQEIPSIEKTLICGDTGLGAMADVESISEFVFEHLRAKAPE